MSEEVKTDGSIESVEKRIQAYVRHWLAIPASPVSIGWMEAIANKVSDKWWRPSESTGVVDNRLVSSDHYTFENVIPDYNPDAVGEKIAKEVEKAQNVEAKHRIFRAIYWGNLYDDTLPLEARYYSTSTDRLQKISAMVVMVLLFFIIATVGPSVLYGKYDTAEGLVSSQNSLFPHISQKTSILDKAEQEYGVKFSSVDGFSDYGGDPLDIAWKIRQDTSKVLSKHDETSTQSWFDDVAWHSSDEWLRKQAIDGAIYIERLLSNKDVFKDLNDAYRLAVTPENNYPEILSQCAIVVLIVLMINWFLSKKIHFSNILARIDRKKRAEALILLEETLLSFFYYRKKYHYTIAFIVASLVMFFHYYTMDMQHQIESISMALPLGIEAYDYRLEGEPRPIYLIYWIVQFMMLYKLVLVAWELGTLNKCMRLWQVKLLKSGVIVREKFPDVFSPLEKEQKDTLRSGISIFLISLVFFSYLKTQGISLQFSDFNGTEWENISSFLLSFLVWNNWYVIYYFLPPILTVSILILSLKPCFVDPVKVKDFGDKKLPDIDQLIRVSVQRAKNFATFGKFMEQAAKDVTDSDKKES